VLGLVLGAWLGVGALRGRGALVTLLNTLLAVPSVVVGLVVYLLLSRSGPLGFLGWLFSFQAMVLAQRCAGAAGVHGAHAATGGRRRAAHGEQLRRWAPAVGCAACCWPGTSATRCSPC
jgi:tungstate transport system permease protein